MTPTTKAVILARGLGRRMRRAAPGAVLDVAQRSVADEGFKGLIPIGRPFLDYVISALADSGIADICLVVGPEHERVRKYYGGEVELSRVRVQFALQTEPLGTADALVAAEAFAGREHVLVINADNYYPVDALRALRELGAPGLAVFERYAMIQCGNIDADRLASFAVVTRDRAGMLGRIIEKPDATTLASLGPDIFVGMNSWSMPPEIYDACRSIQPSPRGELELPDAVQHARDVLGLEFRVLCFRAGVLDLSSRGDITGVAERLRGVEPRL